jgi:hypothetical protein
MFACRVLLPEYQAEILWEPTVRSDLMILAVLVPFSETFDDPNHAIPLSMNVTFSSAAPPEPLTVAVNVTGWLYTEGLSEDVTVTTGVTGVPITPGIITAVIRQINAMVKTIEKSFPALFFVHVIGYTPLWSSLMPVREIYLPDFFIFCNDETIRYEF